MIKLTLLIIAIIVGIFITLAAQMSINTNEIGLKSQLINGGLIAVEKPVSTIQTASLEVE